jgi:hypothetical protein
MMRNATDEGLMLAYAAGDAAAFDTLYGRHRAPVFRYVRRQVQQTDRPGSTKERAL